MNQNFDISWLLRTQQEVIDNGRKEAQAPKDSLERMMFKARRQGRKADAEAIESFLGMAGKELSTFRDISQIGRTDDKTGIFHDVRRKFTVKPSRISPKNIADIADQRLTESTPFLCIEGVSANNNGEADKATGAIESPFFAILTRNVSEASNLPDDKVLVCTFNRAATSQGVGQGVGQEVELRIWKLGTFASLFKGDNLEQSRIGLLPSSNDTVTSITGSLQDLFIQAADHMGRAALSRNPPESVANAWMDILHRYGGVQPQ